MKPFLVFTFSLAGTFMLLAKASSKEQESQFREQIVLASFAADSLCLGPHWLYDIDEIKTLYPEGVTQLDAPKSSYHPSKREGDLTHYGDQSLLLLEHLAESGEWSVASWKEAWKTYWETEPETYFDSATKDTLKNWSNDDFRPSDSHDLAGVSRAAPLLALLAERPVHEVVNAVRDQTTLTHGSPSVADAAEFFTRLVWATRKGIGYEKAIAQALEEGSYQAGFQKEYVDASVGYYESSEAAADHFGQSCDTYNALPLMLWIARNYEQDPAEMLRQNAQVGGDSSARGMLLAMLIVANGDYDKLPKEWIQGLNSLPRIKAALAKFP